MAGWEVHCDDNSCAWDVALASRPALNVTLISLGSDGVSGKLFKNEVRQSKDDCDFFCVCRGSAGEDEG